MQGPELIHSTLLTRAGVPHAFSTRAGGVSSSPFDSLNFGNPMDLPPGVHRDPVANIRENFRLVASAIGAPAREIVQVYQVHGADAKVFRVGDPSRERRAPHPSEPPDDEFDFKADALVTDDPARLLAVRVADCTPILLAAADGSIVAAVHAGWRGVVSCVVLSALDAMSRVAAARGTTLAPQRVLAAIGPSIGPESFEVGPEVVAEFERVFGAWAHVRPHPLAAARAQGKAFIDLKSALRDQLRRRGLEAIDVIDACTASDPARFFSHRRDRGVTGRMIGIIGPK